MFLLFYGYNGEGDLSHRLYSNIVYIISSGLKALLGEIHRREEEIFSTEMQELNSYSNHFVVITSYSIILLFYILICVCLMYDVTRAGRGVVEI